eukprot:15359851-Ditylum_brightwellii.AAC.1
MIDMRNTIANDVVLSRLDAALKPFDVGDQQHEVPRDIFHEIQTIIEQSLATSKFASYLVSDDCSCMRAYLRGTAPYQNIPLDKLIDWEAGDADGDVITTENQNAAHNHLQYLILHLICLMDNESFGEHEHLDSDVVSRRIIGSMGGLTAVVFVRRDLVQANQSASEAVSKDLKADPPASSEEH